MSREVPAALFFILLSRQSSFHRCRSDRLGFFPPPPFPRPPPDILSAPRRPSPPLRPWGAAPCRAAVLGRAPRTGSAGCIWCRRRAPGPRQGWVRLPLPPPLRRPRMLPPSVLLSAQRQQPTARPRPAERPGRETRRQTGGPFRLGRLRLLPRRPSSCLGPGSFSGRHPRRGPSFSSASSFLFPPALPSPHTNTRGREGHPPRRGTNAARASPPQPIRAARQGCLQTSLDQ